MTSVLTLIAPTGASLEDAIVGDVRAALNGLGAETDGAVWLAPGTACDIAFDGIAIDQADSAARAALGDIAVDVIAQPTEDRKKRLLLADMDSTIVTAETLDELAAEVGIKDEIATITARAMNGELDFEAALKERVSRLKGLDESALTRTFDNIEYMPGAELLVRTMAANGARCVLVSGGFKFFTSRVAKHCGFHADLANDFIIEDGKLTGLVTDPVLTKDVKLQTLITEASSIGIPLTATASVGDGANDLPMLKAAGLGVAYHGKPSVRAEAPMRVDHCDLTALLYAQGYRQNEFVS